MPSETGYWNKEEAATNHDFSYQLARWIAGYLPKEIAVYDFGAGNGAYVRYLHDVGFKNVWAFEGDKETVTEIGNIIEQDLSVPFILPRDSIGNSICLEVGEHLPEECLESLLDNVCLNTRYKLILSWAIPGQDGYHHVSCRHNVWVINEMERRGFKLLAEDSLKARSVIEDRMSYFRNTIMIFERCVNLNNANT